MAEIEGSVASVPQNDAESDSESEEEPPKKNVISKLESDSESESEGEGVDIDISDLDAMIADIESQGKRRQRPRVKDLKAVEPRKISSRKKVVNVFEGSDLESVLDEITQFSRQKAAQDMGKIGWGVVNTERKFDLLAPKYVLVGSRVHSTIVVTNPAGERTKIDPKFFKIETTGDVTPASPIVLKDNKDGTYVVEFDVDTVGNLILIVDIFGQRQFEWNITICGVPDPNQCIAEVKSPYRANERCEIIIVAKDTEGQSLKVGGAKFSLGFNGAGQLNDVGLLDLMNGTYSLTFVPSKPGRYAIFISLDGVDISTCPVTFTVV
eukprot:TRINITY_DN3081_c0_g1_i1.p1 TRINITY_DN3081_c0_g1~~TRINITY_DN3081_c0_g1_i1.p1  ORF type:complete len:347 (-),score=95.41 TRINITY_DN3081_c0_g1_i1:263-1231(-)